MATLRNRPGETVTHEPKAKVEGRRCAEGCGTILSIYNPGRYCSLHEGKAAMVVKGRTGLSGWLK